MCCKKISNKVFYLLRITILFFPFNVYAGISAPDETKVLGTSLPNITLFDHNGMQFNFSSLLNKNKVIVVSPVYTKCHHSCPLITSSLKKIISYLYSKGTTDFTVLTISFDSSDTPDDLKNFIKNYKLEDFVSKGIWIVSGGKEEDVRRFLSYMNFVYVKRGEGFFDHPNLIAFISPSGKLSGFLYGVSYDIYNFNSKLNLAKKGGKVVELSKIRLFVLFFGVIGFMLSSIYLILKLSSLKKQ